MENDLRNFDDLFREEFSGYTETPPPAVWPALEKRLDNNKKRRVFPFRWYWFFSILSFITLLGASIAWNIARVPATVALPVPVAEANTIAANDAPAPASNTTTAPTGETAGQQQSANTIHEENSDQPSDKHTGKASHTHKTTRHSHKANTEENAQSDNNSPETEVVVSANAPAVGTSVYSYDDFGDELVVEKKTNAGASDPGSDNTGTYVAKKAKKHNRVAEETVSTSRTEKVSQPDGAIEDRVYSAASNANITGKQPVSTKAITKHEHQNSPVAPASEAGSPVVSKKHTTNDQQHSTLAIVVADKAALSEVRPVGAAAKKTAKSKVTVTEGVRPAGHVADHSVAAATAIVKPTTSAKPIAKTTDKAEQHTAEKAIAITNKPTKTNEPVKQQTADQPLAAAIAAASAPRKTAATAAKKMIADAGTTKEVAANTVNKKQTTAAKSSDAGKSKSGNAAESIIAAAPQPVRHNGNIEKGNIERTADRPTNDEAGKATKVAATKTALKKEAATPHTSASKGKPLVSANVPKEEIASSVTDNGVAEKAQDEKVAAADKETVRKANRVKEKKGNATVAAATKEQHRSGTAKTGSEQALKTGAGTVAAKSNPDFPAAAAKPGPAAKTGTPSDQGTAAAKSLPSSPVVAAKPAAQPKANASAKPAAAEAEQGGEPAPAVALQAAKPEEAKKPAAVVKKEVADTTASAAPATDTTTKEEVSDVMKLVLGVKGGFESGLSRSTGNKFVVSPYLQYRINSKWSLLTQPSIKTAYLSRHIIGNPSAYYNVKPGSGSYTIVDSSIMPVIGSTGLVDSFWVRNYSYSETHDSIVKTNRIGGTYVEVELPLLLQYSITPKLSVYGGLNAVYGKQFKIKENTEVIENVSATGSPFTLLHINAPAVLPTYTGITYTGNPLTSYGGPAYPDQPKGLLRMGYMLGVSYEIKKRWMADVLVQQCFAKQNLQGGYNINSALLMPYVRLTLGYRITK